MKARTPDMSAVIEELCQISVYRMELLMLMSLQDQKGVSDRMINEIIDRFSRLADEYRRNRDCGAGDESLLRDAESRGLPVNQQMREKMLRTERNLWAYGLKGGKLR